MHKYGVHSKQAGRIVRRLNRQAERLSKGLPEDSAAFAIADHGQINCRWAYLEDYPALNDMLLHAPSIEPRALSLFIKEGCRERFSERFKTIFGDSFLLLTKAQVYESGLFGSGTPGKKTDDFIGDFLAVATDELCLAENRKSPAFLGNHAGLTEDEMTVPFIRIK